MRTRNFACPAERKSWWLLVAFCIHINTCARAHTHINTHTETNNKHVYTYDLFYTHTHTHNKPYTAIQSNDIWVYACIGTGEKGKFSKYTRAYRVQFNCRISVRGKKKIGSLTETNVWKYYFVGLFFLFLLRSCVCVFSRYDTLFFFKLGRPGKKPHRARSRTHVRARGTLVHNRFVGGHISPE